MINIENVIVKGRYFVPVKFDNISSLKNTLQEYLAKKLYQPEDLRNVFFQDRFFTQNFRIFLQKPEMPWSLQIKLKLRLLTIEEVEDKFYSQRVSNLRNEIPYEVRISLSVQSINNVDGVVIDITSIPTVFYKVSQKINTRIFLDKNDYVCIAYQNTEFIKEIMAAIHAQVITEPKLLSEYVKSEIIQKLVIYKFEKIAKLLEDGKKKMELGENAIGDLLGAIENFLFDLLNRISIQPDALHKPENNISKFKTNGFITDEIEGSLKCTLFNGIYLKLKDKDHKKEEINYLDLKLYYDIVEDIIDYLLDRVIKYKIKVKDENATKV